MHPTAYDIAIFRALHPENGAQWLDGRTLAAKLKRPYYCYMYDRLRQLAEAGYMLRDKPNTKKSKHSAWARSRKADEYLREHFQEPLPKRSKAWFEHQILDDLDTASLEFGVATDERFKMRRRARLETEYEFDGGNRPLELATQTQHIFLLKEIDRDTEQASLTRKVFSNTGDRRRTWERKIKNMKAFEDEKSKHGLDRLFVRIVTICDAMKRKILDLIKDEVGGCKWIGVTTWRDWGNHNLRKGGQDAYPLPDGHMLRAAYERAGHPPMYLDRFWEC
jgi:hypothetical protein